MGTRTVPNILLVDGSPLMRDNVAARLRDAGYIVHGAADADEAIELLEGVNVDIMLLEPMLPRGCGVELLQRVRSDALFKILPVVIYTRTDDKALMKRITKLKPAVVLQKDRCDFSDVLEAIAQSLPGNATRKAQE